jgi:hypothetical protein
MAADVHFVVVANDEERAAMRAAAPPTEGSSLGQAASAALGYLPWFVVLLAIGLFNENALDHLRAGDAKLLGRENGPLENVQLLVMLPAIGLFWLAGLRGRGAVRVAGVLLALLGSIAMVRELDLETMAGSSAHFDWLAQNGLQDVILGGLALSMALYALLHWRYFGGLLRLGLRWQAWPCVVALLLIAAAEFILDGAVGPNGHFWEELVETNGYFLFAVAAWRHASLIGHPDLDRPV